jgi:integrase/recombinase XerD
MMRSSFDGKYAARDAALFELGIRTGFRISELLAVNVGHVYQNGKMLSSVTVAKCWMKGRKRSRTMPLHSAASDAILRWIEEAGFTATGFADQPLFCRQLTSIRLSRAQAWSIIKLAAIRAGLDTDRVACHSLRKTFATNMWNNSLINKDMAKMAKLLGHQNFSNSLRYLEFLDGSLELAVLSEEIGEGIHFTRAQMIGSQTV